MNKKNLLSIGELAKVTGVHVKALRYYDSIGILTPTYIDPSSSYRYYSFEHKAIVDAIQFCVELDIPLKNFPHFSDRGEGRIDYADLVDCGSDILENKILVMQKRLARLKMMKSEIERSEQSCKSPEPEKYTLPARDCWIVPYDGTQLSEASRQLTKKIILNIHQRKLQLGNVGGLLLLYLDGQWKQFLFVDVQVSETEIQQIPEIIHIPSGVYLCKKVHSSNIDQAWSWSQPFVKPEQIQLIIETELFVGNYNFSSPLLEQRCLLLE